MEPFQSTNSPLVASQSANQSNKLPFGLSVPCPKSHPYCAPCLRTYIMSKLDPAGNGSGNAFSDIVFPIRCPGCPLVDWVDGLVDEVAAKILSQYEMAMWVCLTTQIPNIESL